MTPREKLDLLRSYRAAGGTGSYASLLKEAKSYATGGPKSKPMLPYSPEALVSGTPAFYQAPVSPLYPNEYTKQPAKQEIKRYNKEDLPLYAKAVGTVFGSIGKDIDRSVNLYNTLVDFKNTRVDDKMSDKEAGYRKRLADAQYFSYPREFADIRKFLNRVDSGTDQFENNTTHRRPAEDNVSLRKQLAYKYYGLPYDSTIIVKSQYKPGISKNTNTQYYDFSPKLKEEYISALKKQKNPIDYIKETLDNPEMGMEQLSVLRKKYGIDISTFNKNNPYAGSLGKYKTSVGKDARGKYISIYDEWDIDPPILKEKGIDVDQLNYPFEIYTRIYEDDLIDTTLKEAKSYDAGGPKSKLPTLPTYANVQAVSDNAKMQYTIIDPIKKDKDISEAYKLRLKQKEESLTKHYNQPLVSGMNRKPTQSEIHSHAIKAVDYNDKLSNDPVGTLGPDVAMAVIPELMMLKGPQQAISKGLSYINPIKKTTPWNQGTTDKLKDVVQTYLGPKVSLYRVQPKNFEAFSTIERIEAKKAAGEELNWIQSNILNNPELYKKYKDRSKFHGAWYEKDPNRLDYYLADKFDESPEILQVKIPKNKVNQYSVQNIPEAQKTSLSYNTEFVIPKDIRSRATKHDVSEWEDIKKKYKPFSLGGIKNK